MEKNKFVFSAKSIIFCSFLSLITGVISSILISVFKVLSELIITASAKIYSFVRINPAYLPVLIIGAAALGTIEAVILKYEPNAKGGGTNNAFLIIKNLVSFKWLKSIFAIISSALITYLCSLPLGTEGPSIHLAAICGKKISAFYKNSSPDCKEAVATSGAAAGFAVATGCNISGIAFAIEELQHRVNFILLAVCSLSVFSSAGISALLYKTLGIHKRLFNIKIENSLSLKHIWICVVLGVVCGILAVIFKKIHTFIDNFIKNKTSKIPFTLKMALLFSSVALIGFFLNGILGTGKTTIDKLLTSEFPLILLFFVFLIRALVFMIANSIGVNGGLFLPTLLFGAVLGSFIGEIFVISGVLSAEVLPIIVILGIISYMSAYYTAPVTSFIFGTELILSLSNALPMALCVLISYLTVLLLNKFYINKNK